MLVSKQDIDAEARQNYAGSLQSQTSPVEFGYYAELACSRDVLDFKTRIGAVVDRLGFSDFAFVRLASRDADFSMLMSTPKTLLDSYCQEGLYENDMMFSYAKSKVSPIFRSTLDHYLGQSPVDTNTTRTMKEIYKLNKSLGYYDYYHQYDYNYNNGSPAAAPAASSSLGRTPFDLAARGYTKVPPRLCYYRQRYYRRRG